MDLAPVSKAVASGLAAMAVAYVAKYGVTLDPVVVDAINVLLVAVVSAACGFVVTYFAPKNAEQ